jgi:transposase InsO family protein
MARRGSSARPAPGRLRAAMLACVVAVTAGSVAQADTGAPTVRAHAVRRSGAISIDGRLDEPVWASAPTYGGFVQRFPSDGTAASAETRFAILYDDEAVYVGVWADDPHPELIRALLTRRDLDSSADAVTVEFDSYHDRRTAVAFQLNAAGVQRDMLLFDDTNQDDTWDAVWIGSAAVTTKGWTAEYKIPLSQLRFVSGEAQEWGLQVVRLILDGASRAIVHWDIRESMTETDVECILQRAHEMHPDEKPRIISDNGPQFIAKDFKEYIRLTGMTHVRTAPYYPQSNGKLERYHKTIKSEAIRPGAPRTLDEARARVAKFVEHYNTVRLHSAIGYITPADFLAGRRNEIWAARDRKLEAAREVRARRRAELREAA